MDIVLHELFHYFYQEAPYSVHVDIIDTMAKTSFVDAFNAYSLMNEAFATALGQAPGSTRSPPMIGVGSSRAGAVHGSAEARTTRTPSTT